MYEEILAAAQDADIDADVRAVVLTGAGTVFCAGQDNSATSRQDVTAYKRYELVNQEAHAFLRRMTKPLM